jgi:hypothetical protein
MVRWTPPNESEHVPAPPLGSVHIGKRVPHTPPHVHIYAGLHHVSGQIEEVGVLLKDTLLEVVELKRLVNEIIARSDSVD